MANNRTNATASKRIRKELEKAAKGARKIGGRVANIMAETPEFVALVRNDRALRSEMDEHMRRIGRRALILHKRTKKNPFDNFPVITRELETLTRLETEYRLNRVRLNEVKREMKGKKP